MNDLISITLTRAQISHVLHQAQGTTGIAAALSGLPDNDKLAQAYNTIKGEQELSRSLLVGLVVLRCFPEDGSSMGVKEVADILKTQSISTTLRYIKTLLAVGLLEQEPKTRRYHLSGRQPAVEESEKGTVQ